MSELTKLEQPAELAISKENAEKQLRQLFDYYEIEIEDYEGIKVKGTNVKKALGFARQKLFKAIRKGRLEIGKNDQGQFNITQHLTGAYKTLKRIDYRPLRLEDKTIMGNEDSENDNAQMYALLASMSRTDPSIFRALEGVDATTAECLGNFFLLG
jgi:hypothetical protein